MVLFVDAINRLIYRVTLRNAAVGHAPKFT
jgi:hypothetical protein